MGTIIADNTTHLFSFHADNQTKRIIINACDSTYNTKLYLYNQSHDQIAYNDDSILCDEDQSIIHYPGLTEGNYSIAITGMNNSYGNYSLKLSCYPRQYSRYECMMYMYNSL